MRKNLVNILAQKICCKRSVINSNILFRKRFIFISYSTKQDCEILQEQEQKIIVSYRFFLNIPGETCINGFPHWNFYMWLIYDMRLGGLAAKIFWKR